MIMINDDFICPLSDEKIDYGWCNVMFDVLNGVLKESCVPEGYADKENFREICKNCESYKTMIELNS